MKLFYKKDYENIKNQLGIKILENINLIEESEKLKEQMLKFDREMADENFKLTSEILNLKSELKKEKGAKGGLTKQVNKLNSKLEEKDTEIKEFKKQIKELEKKLEESMTDKYLVKKIPSGRIPVAKSKLKPAMKPAVLKYMQNQDKDLDL